MRKLLLVIIATVTIAAVAIAAGFGAVIATYRHQARNDLARGEALEADMQKLKVGTSDYKAARVIADKFGTIPFVSGYEGTPDCADGYFKRCRYMIPSNHNQRHELVVRHPFLRHLGLHDWSGNAQIYIENGIVQHYFFLILYKTSDGHSLGLAAEEGKKLPEDRAVTARISNSYSIAAMDGRPNSLAFFLESSLTPAATPIERQHAWHFDFSCLSQQRGCGEICQVMPDAWRDFYTQRGHFDVEKYGSAYLFCAKPPM
jgi:hypothetical protein